MIENGYVTHTRHTTYEFYFRARRCAKEIMGETADEN